MRGGWRRDELDVLANLDHLLLINLSVPAAQLASLLLGAGPGDLDWTLEACYFVGPLPRYWRWLASEVPEAMTVPEAVAAT